MNFPPIIFYDQQYLNICTNIHPMKNSSSIISYQNLYRKLLKFENKDNNFQSSVINWLKKLTKNQLIKYFSFNNQWLVDIIHEMIIISKFNPSTKYIFKPAISNNHITIPFFHLFEPNNISLYNPNYTDYFSLCYSDIINLRSKSYYEELQKRFIDYIRYLTIPSNTQNNDKDKINEKFFFEYNNVVTLSYEYLSDINNLIDIMRRLSNNQIFKYPIEIETKYNELEKKYYYNACLSKWLKNEFTLSELLCCYFEQCILINYEYHLLYKKEIDFLYYDKLEELINNNEKLIEFIDNANEKKFEIIQIIKIDGKQFLGDNIYIMEIISEKKMRNHYLNFNYCHKNDDDIKQINQSLKVIIDKTMILLEKTLNKDVKDFINLLTYIKDTYVFKEEDFIFKFVYDKINNYWKDKIAEDLITNYDNNPNKKKKKKKKKKNNEKKEENNINLENDNKNNVNNNININIIPPQINEVKENIINNNDNDKNNDLIEKINNVKNEKLLFNKTEVSTQIKIDNTDNENMMNNINNKIDYSNNNTINNNNNFIINEENKISLNDKEENNHNTTNEIKEESQKEELNEEEEKEENNKNKKEKTFFLYPTVKNKKKKNNNKKK